MVANGLKEENNFLSREASNLELLFLQKNCDIHSFWFQFLQFCQLDLFIFGINFYYYFLNYKTFLILNWTSNFSITMKQAVKIPVFKIKGYRKVFCRDDVFYESSSLSSIVMEIFLIELQVKRYCSE